MTPNTPDRETVHSDAPIPDNSLHEALPSQSDETTNTLDTPQSERDTVPGLVEEMLTYGRECGLRNELMEWPEKAVPFCERLEALISAAHESGKATVYDQVASMSEQGKSGTSIGIWALGQLTRLAALEREDGMEK